MPNKGQRTVTIREDLYKEAQKKAKKQKKSVAGFVSDAINHQIKEAKA